jgi:hypothetical protein
MDGQLSGFVHQYWGSSRCWFGARVCSPLESLSLVFLSFSPFRREFLVVQQMRRPPAELLEKE